MDVEKRILCSARMRRSNFTAAMSSVEYVEDVGTWFLKKIGPDGNLKKNTFYFFNLESLEKGEKLISVFMRAVAKQDISFCDVFYVNVRDGLDTYFDHPSYSGHFSDFDGFLFVFLHDLMSIDDREHFLKILEKRIGNISPTIIVSNEKFFGQLLSCGENRVNLMFNNFSKVSL